MYVAGAVVASRAAHTPRAGIIAHTKYSLWAVNALGVVKMATLAFISITGFVVLGGGAARVANPGSNFRDAFAGTTDNGNDLATAMVSIVFSYSGYSMAFNVVNEIKNPIGAIKRYGLASLFIVTALYMLCNVAYFSAVDRQAFRASREIAAGVFFTAVFGRGTAATALNFMVLFSAFGNLLAILIGQTRITREIGRQGVLPYTPFWVSTRPFGTPIGPAVIKWVITLLMITAPPAGDAFQFAISLATYPNGMFSLAMGIGVYIIRRRRARSNLPPSGFRTWHIALIFYILIQVYILAMPWWPPKGGPYAGSVSFWYATYCVTGIAMCVGCVPYAPYGRLTTLE